MRIRMVLAAVVAVLALAPAAAWAGTASPSMIDGLNWTGHSICATAVFESYKLDEIGGDHYLSMSGTVKPCDKADAGDFFAVATYDAGGGYAKALLYYDQASSTYFQGRLKLGQPVPVCLASWYTVRMACLSVTANGSDWSVAPLPVDDPWITVPISDDTFGVEPQCATCWGD